jgi:hypothetical protein
VADQLAGQRHRGAVAERRPAEALRAWATSRDPPTITSNIDELGKLVVARVQAVDGITRTLTCPVVHL